MEIQDIVSLKIRIVKPTEVKIGALVILADSKIHKILEVHENNPEGKAIFRITLKCQNSLNGEKCQVSMNSTDNIFFVDSTEEEMMLLVKAKELNS